MARAQKPADLLEKKTIPDAKGKTLPYRLLKPDNYDPKQSYPLVVFLHGAGERGTDNDKQLVHGVGDFASAENRQKYPCFLIAPQCPNESKWCEVDWGALSHTMPKEPSEPARLTLELIAAMQKDFSIDAKRIYLTGLSMGGYGTWDLLARRPDLFAAGVPICGGGDEATAATIAKIPIWAFHGDKDTAVKVVRSRNMIEALKKADGVPKYTEYPGVGHNSWSKAYSDPEMMKWLFAQKRD
jgi:predicted peptidase